MCLQEQPSGHEIITMLIILYMLFCVAYKVLCKIEHIKNSNWFLLLINFYIWILLYILL